MTDRPLLLLDVDGVCLPVGEELPDHLVEVAGLGRVDPGLSGRLARLCRLFEIRWCTAWGEDAARLVGPALGLCDLAVVALDHLSVDAEWKLPGIAAVAGRRPLALVDDEIGPAIRAWAAGRPAPTLLVAVDPARGLGAAHERMLAAFAAELSGRR